jgi:YkoY family integral membrane protein
MACGKPCADPNIGPDTARVNLSSSILVRMFEASDLITIALLVALEGLLSADNALVIAVMVLGLPKREHRAALHYGLIGAFAFRIVATLLAMYLMRLVWVKLLGGLYLLYLAYSHFHGGKSEEERRAPPKATAWLGMSAFWATVVRVELVNLAFSIDSILVAVAVSPKRWVVLSGGIIGIVAMRLVVGQLIALIERLPTLVDAAFIIIAWVGIKLTLDYLHAAGFLHVEIPQWISLGLILVILAVALFHALRQERRQGSGKAERAAQRLLNEEEDVR